MHTKGLFIDGKKVPKNEVKNIIKNLAKWNDIQLKGHDAESDRFYYNITLKEDHLSYFMGPLIGRFHSAQVYPDWTTLEFVIHKNSLVELDALFPLWRYSNYDKNVKDEGESE